MSLLQTTLATPIGTLWLAAHATGATHVRFSEPPGYRNSDTDDTAHPLRQLAAELEAYFEDPTHTFTCPINPQGTDFQRAVWQQLAAIPHGTTVSYGELAQTLDRPKAFRAVGGANNRNPLPILLPCHRVVGASGALVGYAGELWRKEWLLQHEGALLATT